MTRCMVLVVVLVVASIAITAWVPSPSRAAEVAAGSLADFQSRHPTCSFITDDCTICARDGDHLACSTAGIACQPGPLRCNGAEPEPIRPKVDPAK